MAAKWVEGEVDVMDIDDLESDFEGTIKKYADQVGNELEFIHKTLGEEGYQKELLSRSARHLVKMIDLDAPDCIIEIACKHVTRRALTRWPDLMKEQTNA